MTYKTLPRTSVQKLILYIKNNESDIPVLQPFSTMAKT